MNQMPEITFASPTVTAAYPQGWRTDEIPVMDHGSIPIATTTRNIPRCPAPGWRFPSTTMAGMSAIPITMRRSTGFQRELMTVQNLFLSF